MKYYTERGWILVTSTMPYSSCFCFKLNNSEVMLSPKCYWLNMILHFKHKFMSLIVIDAVIVFSFMSSDSGRWSWPGLKPLLQTRRRAVLLFCCGWGQVKITLQYTHIHTHTVHATTHTKDTNVHQSKHQSHTNKQQCVSRKAKRMVLHSNL